jgi:MFS family permease
VILYLTYWFPSAYRARIMSMFFMAITFAGMLGGPLSGWILNSFTDVGGLKDWQWLFIIEGLPAVLLDCIAYFCLADRPDDAKWLTENEKQIVREDLLADTNARPAAAEHALMGAVHNPKVYIAGLVYFSIIAGNNAMQIWMPTVIKDFGVDNMLTIGMVSSLPYVVGAIAMYLMSRHSDKRMERRWHVAIALLVAAASYALLGNFSTSPVVAIGLLAVSAAGVLSAMSIFWTIPPAYLTGAAAAGGIALVSSIGMMGGSVSPILMGWAKTATGSLQAGFWAMAAILALGALTLLLGIPKSTLASRDKP